MVSGHLVQLAFEVPFEVVDVPEQPLALDDVYVLDGDRARDGMPPEGRTMHEHRGVVLERRAHLLVHYNPAHRQVARRYALGEARHIGDHVEALDAEPFAEPPEGTDHRVRDKEDAVFVADLTHPLPVIWGRHEAPTCVLHGLQDDGSHRLRRPELYSLFDGVRSPLRVLLGVSDVVEALKQRLEGSLERR